MIVFTQPLPIADISTVNWATPTSQKQTFR
jgi:hypothetical protein